MLIVRTFLSPLLAINRVLSQINEWIRIQDVSSYNRFKTLLSRYLRSCSSSFPLLSLPLFFYNLIRTPSFSRSTAGRVGANIEPSGAAAYPSQSIVSSSAYAGSSANGWDHISNYHSQPAASSSQYPITGGLAASRPAPSSYAPPPKKARQSSLSRSGSLGLRWLTWISCSSLRCVASVNWKESPLFKVVQPISDLTAVKGERVSPLLSVACRAGLLTIFCFYLSICRVSTRSRSTSRHLLVCHVRSRSIDGQRVRSAKFPILPYTLY
jgi:hypothetical protein